MTLSDGINIIPIGIQLRNRYELENIAASQGVTTYEIDSELQLLAMSDQMLRPVMDSKYCYNLFSYRL